MHVVACRVEISIPGSRSLKDRRRVVNSCMERLRNRFALAVAQVDTSDHWQRSAIGMACVSNDLGHAREVIEEALRWLQGNLDGEIIQKETLTL